MAFAIKTDNRARDMVDAVANLFSIYGALKEYLLIGMGWKDKWTWFRFWYGRGVGFISIFRGFVLLLWGGTITTGIILDWPLYFFIVGGMIYVWFCYTAGFIEYKVKLIDIESKIGYREANEPMRRLEENTEEIKRLLKGQNNKK